MRNATLPFRIAHVQELSGKLRNACINRCSFVMYLCLTHINLVGTLFIVIPMLETWRSDNVTSLQVGELVAQFKATVLLMPNGSDRITNAPVQKIETDKSVTDDEIRKVLQSSLKSAKAKKSKKKKGKGPAEKGDEEMVPASPET
jgi:hypothetical protein